MNGYRLPTVTIGDVLDVSRSAYYDWLTREPGAREQELDELTPAVVGIVVRHRRRYGARRIASELADEGITCSLRRVAGVLKSQGLRAIQPKSVMPRTTDSRHAPGYSPNLLLDAGEPTRVDEWWVGDITYLPRRGGGFGYLAVLRDPYSRDLVAWSIDATMAESLVLDVLHRAIRERQPRAGLGHHTDRGGQYAGTEYRAVLRRASMKPSMSRADNGYDNAFMESCWSAIQRELEVAEYDSVAAARTVVAEYVRYYRSSGSIRPSATSHPTNSQPAPWPRTKQLDCPSNRQHPTSSVYGGRGRGMGAPLGAVRGRPRR